jgi:hypothetical protein
MHEELIIVAYDLLSSYVLPGKAYDVLEALAYRSSIVDLEQEDPDDINYNKLRVSAMKDAVSALHAAHKKWDEEASKRQSFAIIDPIWNEVEMQA